jgi:AcrR family transcriptional regulator
MPKVIDHDERRREIIEVAKSIILKGGFEAATMRSIAAEAGFANGALKHYFDGKDAIVAATFSSILEELGEAVNAEVPGGADEQLRAFLRAPLPHTRDEIAAGRVLLALWENAMSSEELADLYRQHLASWRAQCIERLAEAKDAGVISAEAPYEPYANEYISTVIGSAVVNLMYPDGDRIADYDQYLDGFLARLKG